MNLQNNSKIIVDKSKFFGYLFEINNLDEIKEIVEKISLKDKKICHICYGISFKDEEIFKNDGEVGQPGKILLNLLKNNNLNEHILIVARIFGRIKLGPAGVGKAFKRCGEECLFG
ncbi:MAG TPA: YigZ family protein [Candidatus Nanoarchaeia archaeon]|nr:YigZ family protein [Candidatus Nanoarchaeia archaeon]